MGPNPQRMILTIRQRSTITISADSVVDLAKSTLVLSPCDALVRTRHKEGKGSEMGICGQKIGCWKAFHRHQIKHCYSRRVGVKTTHSCRHASDTVFQLPNGGAQYICQLSKCSAKLHGSVASLQAHIENAHMKNWPLPCPFTNCAPHSLGFQQPPRITFTRSRDLITHLKEKHADLLGRDIDLNDPILCPRWEPLPPTHIWAPPPLPLSNDIQLGSLFIGSVTLHSTPRFMRMISGPNITSLPASHAPRTPKGRRMLRSHPDHEPSPSIHPGSHYEFDDLPKIDAEITNILGTPHCVVQLIDKGLSRKDLVRALPICAVPLVARPPPPTSIFYPFLREQVLAEYALGKGAAADETKNLDWD
ncbi:hypothetical protein B0H11DRAFT_1335387 [Mycena galericulata]|nr:hypothetical protein B0H11DRAFT_502335 [Mycena galericulata]KAJ7473737.1 hypothetical protein B0H11DRAFT_1335387 [Mycena galericulata]